MCRPSPGTFLFIRQVVLGPRPSGRTKSQGGDSIGTFSHSWGSGEGDADAGLSVGVVTVTQPRGLYWN